MSALELKTLNTVKFSRNLYKEWDPGWHSTFLVEFFPPACGMERIHVWAVYRQTYTQGAEHSKKHSSSIPQFPLNQKKIPTHIDHQSLESPKLQLLQSKSETFLTLCDMLKLGTIQGFLHTVSVLGTGKVSLGRKLAVPRRKLSKWFLPLETNPNLTSQRRPWWGVRGECWDISVHSLCKDPCTAL